MEEETLNSKAQLPSAQEDESESMADSPHQNPQSDSDSDSEEDEALDHHQLQTLEAELSTNPSNYDTHVQVSHPLLLPEFYLLECHLLCLVAENYQERKKTQ